MRGSIVLLPVLMVLAGAASAADGLVVTELMYNSPGTDVEWIELYNTSGATIDLTGWWVIDNNETHDHVPLSGSMAPGDVMVLAGDETLFTTRYPDVTSYFPVFFQTYGDSWSLGNGGDGVRIHDAAGTLVFTMDYDDGGDWPAAADGDGPSLRLVSTGCADYSAPGCWEAGQDWGTPGVLETTVGDVPAAWSQVKANYR